MATSPDWVGSSSPSQSPSSSTTTSAGQVMSMVGATVSIIRMNWCVVVELPQASTTV